MPHGGGQLNARQLTAHIKNTKGLEDVARILVDHRGVLNQIHVSASWGALARIGTGGGTGAGDVRDIVAVLQDRTRDFQELFEGREIATMLHSKAKLLQMGVPPDRGLLEALQRRAMATVVDFNPQEVSNVLWAMAKMGERVDRGLLEALQRRATVSAGEYKPQNVANVLWALATMGERADRGLLEAMQGRAMATAWEGTPQHIANMLWALATMGEKADREFLEVMQRRATAMAGDFKPKEVSNVLWALATMGEKADPGLLEAMQGRATATAGQLVPQDIANVLWAVATMGEQADRGMMEAMQMRAIATTGEFKPQNVGNVLWALATMGAKAVRGMLEAMQRRATATAAVFNPQDLSNVLWALATMAVPVHRVLLEAMQRRGVATAAEFKAQHLSNVFWALATTGETADRELLEAMQRRAMALAGELRAQHCCSMLWALALMGEVGNGFAHALIDLLATRVLIECPDSFNHWNHAQLHQFLLTCELDMDSGASFSSSVARVKQELGKVCFQAFTQQGATDSWLQRDVAAELKQAGPEVEMEEEYRDAKSGYSIDVLVRRRSPSGIHETAVEVDGPSHFLKDGRRPDGSTLLKRKQLGQLGYTVVSVPFWEWDVLRDRGDGEAKRCYLQEKLGWRDSVSSGFGGAGGFVMQGWGTLGRAPAGAAGAAVLPWRGPMGNGFGMGGMSNGFVWGGAARVVGGGANLPAKGWGTLSR